MLHQNQVLSHLLIFAEKEKPPLSKIKYDCWEYFGLRIQSPDTIIGCTVQAATLLCLFLGS